MAQRIFRSILENAFNVGKYLTSLTTGDSDEKLEAVLKVSRLLREPESRIAFSPFYRNFIQALFAIVDCKDARDGLVLESLYLLRSFITESNSNLDIQQIGILRRRIDKFDEKNDLHVIETNCLQLLRDELTRNSNSAHRLEISTILLSFVRYSLNARAPIHEQLCVFVDYLVIDEEIDAYRSGLFDLLTPPFQVIHRTAINLLNFRIRESIGMGKIIVPDLHLIPDMLATFYISCIERGSAEAYKKFVYEFSFIQQLNELFQHRTAQGKELKEDDVFLPLCDIIYYICCVCKKNMMSLMKPESKLAPSLAILLLGGNDVAKIKALAILESIITNLSQHNCRICAQTSGTNTQGKPQDDKTEEQEMNDFLTYRLAVEAIQCHDIDALNQLLAEGLDVERHDHRNQTLLQWAASFGTPEMVEFIYSKLPAAARIDPVALHCAIALGRMDVCRTLLQHDELLGDRYPIAVLINAAKGLKKSDLEEIKRLLTSKARTLNHEMQNQDVAETPRRPSNNRVAVMFAAEIIPVLITVFHRTTVGPIRRIAIHLIKRLIEEMSTKCIEVISALPLRGCTLGHVLCRLVGAAFSHDDGLTVEEAASLISRLLQKLPRLYQELVSRYCLKQALDDFKTIRALSLFPPLRGGKEKLAFEIMHSKEFPTGPQLWQGWTIFEMKDLLIIYSEMAVAAFRTTSDDHISCHFFSADGGIIVKECSDHYDQPYSLIDQEYNLRCLVDVIRQIYPKVEICKKLQGLCVLEDHRGQKEMSVEGNPKYLVTISDSPVSNTRIPVGNLLLDCVEVGRGDFHLRVSLRTGCNESSCLFSGSENLAFYFISPPLEEGYEMAALGNRDQVLMNGANHYITYVSGSLKKPLDHLHSITAEDFSHHESRFRPNLGEIAADIFRISMVEGEGSALRHLKTNFGKLRNLFSKTKGSITPFEVLSSGIVPALLRCLSISAWIHWNKVDDRHTKLDHLDFLLKRREAFLSTFSRTSEYSELIGCIRNTLEQIEYLPLYLLSYLHILNPTMEVEKSVSSFDTNHFKICGKGGLEGSIDFNVMKILSSWISALPGQNEGSENNVNHPLYRWQLSFRQRAFGDDLINQEESDIHFLTIRNQHSTHQALLENRVRLIDSCAVLAGSELGARFVIDLSIQLAPSAYTLTTVRNMDRNEDVENWCLQASNDGKYWTTLKVHARDRSLNSKNAVTFDLDPSEFRPQPNGDESADFRIFRIVDLSPISHQGRLHVCGLDFYGVIKGFHEAPFPAEMLACIPCSMQLCLSASIQTEHGHLTVADCLMLNRMKAIRNGDFFVPPTDFAHTSSYPIAEGLGLSVDMYPRSFICEVTPTSTNFLSILNSLPRTFPFWQVHFELVAEVNGEVVASSSIFDLKAPIFPHIMDLAKQIAKQEEGESGREKAILVLQVKPILPDDLNTIEQDGMKKQGKLLSDADLLLTRQREENIANKFTGTSAAKASAEDMLKLIQLLFHLRAENDPSFTSHIDTFVSQSLSNKLQRQLEDNLATMAGSSFPDWCFNLTQNMNYLFPFELRKSFFKACAFGPARSIQWIQDNDSVQKFSNFPNFIYREMHSRLGMEFDQVGATYFDQALTELTNRRESVNIGHVLHSEATISRDPTESDKGELFWKWAEEVLEEHAGLKTRLDFLFQDEPGRGDGVTRDFFSAISKELQRRCHSLWLNDREKEAGEFVNPKFGLFPTPYPRDAVPLNVLRRFYIMGIAMAKALQDDHLLDLPLSKPFLKILSAYARTQQYCNRIDNCDGERRLNDLSSIENSRDKALSFEDVCIFANHRRTTKTHWLTGLLGFEDFVLLYPFHASVFRDLLCLHKTHETIRKGFTKRQSKTDIESLLDEASLQQMNATIEDITLSMEFTASSSEKCQNVKLMDVYPWELGEFGREERGEIASELINNNNYMDYIRRTIEFCLDKGIRAQMEAFTVGFNRVFSLKWLSIFTSSELSGIICGEPIDLAWTREELMENITTTDVSTKSSPTFGYFVEVLADLDVEERRNFLRWTTGYSTLPMGGLKNLWPPLALVLRPHGSSFRYPSVQTCLHRIEIPAYSSVAELRMHLVLAISESTFELF
ncbi:hypothetical protein Aperf_G00000051664 [Anoplocephala perfoliata]